MGDVLQCPHCADERCSPDLPCWQITGTVGVGKSTLCARLAGTIPGTVLLDADIFDEDLVNVVPPRDDLDGLRPSEVAAQSQITKQSVNDLIGHLEQRGYVVRTPDPADGPPASFDSPPRDTDSKRPSTTKPKQLSSGPRCSEPDNFAQLRRALEALTRRVKDVPPV